MVIYLIPFCISKSNAYCILQSFIRGKICLETFGRKSIYIQTIKKSLGGILGHD